MRKYLHPWVFIIGSAAFQPSYGQQAVRPIYIAGHAQGTTYQVTYYAANDPVSQQQLDSIFDKIDSSLSIYKPYSLVSRFNNAVNRVKMDDHLETVIKHSLQAFTATGGIFDITVYPILAAWGFGPSPKSGPPDSATIKALLTCVGSRKIHIANGWLVKDLPCIKLDPDGIAQGYSVDVVAAYLERQGIHNYLVEIGGEIRLKGFRQPGNQPMQVGIEAPSENASGDPFLQCVIQPPDGALTTSGNYRKYIEKGGNKISHLVNPKTGYPVTNELISVTLWSKDAITADAYDNALMGMGLKSGLKFIEKRAGMQGYFIYHDAKGQVKDTATAGFYKMMRKGNHPSNHAQ